MKYLLFAGNHLKYDLISMLNSGWLGEDVAKFDLQ